jgi:hypothetical protein
MYSLIHLLKYNYEASGTMWSICIVNQWIVSYWRIYVKSSKKLINKKKLNINLVQQLWLDLNQERIYQVLLVIIGYPWKQLDHKKKFFKNESMEDLKCCVRQDGSWRTINMDLATMNHASEKSMWESWCRGTICDGEGQVDVQSEESSYPWRITYHYVSISVESRYEVTWRSKVEIDHTEWSTPRHNL